MDMLYHGLHVPVQYLWLEIVQIVFPRKQVPRLFENYEESDVPTLILPFNTIKVKSVGRALVDF